MAAKQQLRPVSPLYPSWANDDLISDSGEPWDGNYNRVEPGDGKRDIGWLPDEQPAAQHANVLHNEAGKWAQYGADAGIMDLRLERPLVAPFVPCQHLCATYDEGAGLWMFGGIDAKNTYSYRLARYYNITGDGVTFLDFLAAVSKPPNSGTAHTGARTVLAGALSSGTSGAALWKITGTRSALTKTSYALSTYAKIFAGCWDTTESKFLFVGEKNSPADPCTISANYLATTWTEALLIHTNSTRAVAVACGGFPGAEFAIAIGDKLTSGSGTLEYWTKTSTTWTARTFNTGLSTVTVDCTAGVVFHNNLCYLIVRNSTTGSIRLFVSIDSGVSFSLVSTLTPITGYATGFTLTMRSFASVGGFLTIAERDGNGLLWSVDGAQWRVIPLEKPVGLVATYGPPPMTFSRLEGRAILCIPGDNEHDMGDVYSTPALQTSVVDSTGYSEPQVTI